MSNPDPGRLESALTAADDAFWAEIAKAYPEIKTGDLSPQATDRWLQITQEVVSEWLDLNTPEAYGSSAQNQLKKNARREGSYYRTGRTASRRPFPPTPETP